MFTSNDRFFLSAAFLSFLGSVSLWFFHDRGHGMFVGLWVPTILALWVWVGVRLVLLAEHAGLHDEDEPEPEKEDES